MRAHKHLVNSFLLVTIVLAQAGCVIFTKYDRPKDQKSPYPEPPSEIQPRGGKVDWGISLSGGGIRSGAFSLGALKALYDRGYLEEVDAVSVVSGGGYAWYWLLANNEANKKFGESVFNDKAWLRKNAELQLNAKFAPNGPALSRLFMPVSAGARFYEERIVHFGHSRYDSNGSMYFSRPPCNALEEKISSYLEKVRSREIPYFFVNATMSTPRCGAGKLIEITPSHIGNATFNYRSWEKYDQDKVMRMPQALAISGAAWIERLAQKVPDYLHGTNTEMTLYDGGGGSDQGENLGAYALIRRGIPNIIIIDAEADPNYVFQAYTRLKKLLARDGITFRVHNIDRYICNGSPGNFGTAPMNDGCAHGSDANGQPFKSRIFYIKMCMPNGWFHVNRNKNAYAVDGADDVSLSRVDNAIRPNGKFAPAGLSELDKLAQTGLKLDDGYYRAVVRNYATSLNLRPAWRARIMNALPGTLSKYSFPHMSTLDQSYYNDQIEALLGLGFLQASSLPHVREVRGSCVKKPPCP